MLEYPPRAQRSSAVALLCGFSLLGCSGADSSGLPSTISEPTSLAAGDSLDGDDTDPALAAQVVSAPTAGNAQVLQYHNDARRSGVFVDAAFTRQAAARLHRDKTFTARVAGPTYAQPLYVTAPSGKDLLIVATEQNQVSAFDAASGAVVWQKTLAPPATRASLPCGNISPLGVTGTPVIDEKSGTLVVAAMTLEGGRPRHKIFALSIADGSVKPGWPASVDGVRSGSVAFESPAQNQRGALVIMNDTVYVPYGGHFGDCGNYRGWVIGVPLDKPSAPFGWATRAKAGGIWAPGGISSDGSHVFVATGNTMAPTGGLFSAPSTWGDGEAVIRLPANLQFSVADANYAAAMNWQQLDRVDADIGGTAPVLFDLPGATPSTLGLALGKDGSSYLLNTTYLGGIGRFVSTPGRVAAEAIITAPTAYSTPSGTFVAFKGNGSRCPSTANGRKITALKLEPGSPPTISTAWCAGPNGSGSPISTATTSSGAESIVWYVTSDGDNKLRGFNGETGAVVFAGGGPDEQMQAIARFQTPIVAKGRVFVAGNNEVYAFSLN